MIPDQQRLTADERSQLVAYLDGELPNEMAERINAKLGQSMTARREVEALKKTWELLDLLPLPRASEEFTHKTLTIVSDRDNHGAELATKASSYLQRSGTLVGWFLGSASFYLVGYLVVLHLWPNPSARLAQDLPIAEFLDAYHEVGSLELLKDLDSNPDFN